MADYSRQSRFFFDSYRKIQDGINAGQINRWDVVLCSDTREMILIDDNFELVPIHSKVLRFSDIASAESYLNSVSDTYQGQIVSILSARLGSYQAYIVNQNESNGHFFVSPISTYEPSDIDYNVIGNRPIENKEGDIDHPIVLANLDNGVYRINGAYKITDGIITIYQSFNSDLFTITHRQDETTVIRILGSTSIENYIVAPNGTDVVRTETVATREWIESQGYMNGQALDAKLAALDLFTRAEARDYIEQIISDVVTRIVQEKFGEEFESHLNESLKEEDQASIYQLFDIYLTNSDGTQAYPGTYDMP